MAKKPNDLADKRRGFERKRSSWAENDSRHLRFADSYSSPDLYQEIPMATRYSIGGIVHTYQKYGPHEFPSPTQPPPDLVSPAFEHLLRSLRPVPRKQYESAGGRHVIHPKPEWSRAYVGVWAVIDAGFEEFFSEPCVLGRLDLSDERKPRRRWWV